MGGGYTDGTTNVNGNDAFVTIFPSSEIGNLVNMHPSGDPSSAWEFDIEDANDVSGAPTASFFREAIQAELRG